METSVMKLHQQRHPHKDYHQRYKSLIGLEIQQAQLLRNLHLFFDQSIIDQWKKKHHKKGLRILKSRTHFSPLILLSGDVGCGKTELAQTIGTPLSEILGGETIVTFETPSDIRGRGHVGELSSRITAAFSAAKSNLRARELGILIIDEADDLATNRDQNQAHHEDRAGVDVLIKEVDRIEREKTPLAILMITNRFHVLDPAIVRRASVQLEFVRPDESTMMRLLESLFGDVVQEDELNRIQTACIKPPVRYTYSDLIKRLPRLCLSIAIDRNDPISIELILEGVDQLNPSPEIL